MKNLHSAWLTPFFCLLTLSLAAQEFGMASYYSDRYQGRKTAYGDFYDMSKLTCSHKKHPYGTLLKITRTDNNRSVICRVIDKGPYTKGRIVDLSRAAAEQIDLIQDGTTEVKVDIYRQSTEAQPLAGASQPSREFETPTPSRATQETTPRQTETTPPPAPATLPAQKEETPARPATDAATAPAPASARFTPAQDYARYGLYKIRVDRGLPQGYAVQVMVVSDYENLLKALIDYQGRGFDNILVSIEPGQNNQTFYKIVLGPFDTEKAAQSYQGSLKSRYKINGFVVNLTEKTYPAAPTPPRP